MQVTTKNIWAFSLTKPLFLLCPLGFIFRKRENQWQWLFLAVACDLLSKSIKLFFFQFDLVDANIIITCQTPFLLLYVLHALLFFEYMLNLLDTLMNVFLF